MQSDRAWFRIRFAAKAVLAGFLTVSLLFAAALAVRPALHEHFHAGAASDGHSCAATLLEHGKVASAAAAPGLLVFVLHFLFTLPLARRTVLSVPDLRLDFGRGPPQLPGLR